MYYAQKNYANLQGIAGKYPISAIGCLLTLQCNIEADYGFDISPPSLNDFYVKHGTYIDIDDGIRDDLGWGSLTVFDPRISVTKTVDHGKERTAGWPSTNNAGVRFYYQSVQHPWLDAAKTKPNMITHFAKVADFKKHLILDSYDGVVKASPYGEPTAWAEYSRANPVAPTPQAPAPAPAPKPIPKTCTYQRLEKPVLYRTKVAPTTAWWNLNNVGGWADFKKASNLPADTPFLVVGIASHHLGGKYGMRKEEFDLAEKGDYRFNNGINMDDLKLDAPTPPPTVAPTPAATPVAVQPQLEVTNPMEDDNTVPVRVVPADPLAWQQTLVKFLSPVDYVALEDEIVNDLTGLDATQKGIEKGRTYNMSGTVVKDSKIYLLTTKSVQNLELNSKLPWYGIREAALRKKNLDEDDKIFDGLAIPAELPDSARDSAIKAAAEAKSLIDRLLELFKLKRI